MSKNQNQIYSKQSGSQFFFEDIPRFIVAPLVRFLAKFKFIQPEYIVLLGFALRFVALYMFYNESEDRLSILILLIVGVLLDYVDGMLARATNNVRATGGLLDLQADFIISLLIFVAVSNQPSLLVFIAAVCYFICAEINSYAMYQARNKGKDLSEIANNFMNNSSYDGKNKVLYSVLKTFYNLTWKQLFRLVMIFRISQIRFSNSQINCLNIASIGYMQLSLAIFAYFGKAEMFLYYLVAIGIFTALVVLSKLRKSH
jgi:phosphatidylglycerophosphate synthase